MDLTRRLAGKTCIVTGSGGSIGRATCLRFAAEGANVVGCDIAAPGAEETVRLVEAAGGTMISVHPADLTDKAACERLVRNAVDRFGGIDVLFNNGAMAYFAWIEEMDDDTWYKTINQELDLVFLLTRAAWAELGKSKGCIVNTASLSAWAGIERLPGLAHSAAKGGVLAMTRQLAMEGRKHGIRANSVSPGTIETNQTRFILEDPEWTRVQVGRAMMNRMGQPEEVASVVAFLASADASYVTGADIAIDGGVRAW
jgi:NAD(P)-dependent dehydrogenase (short-subunit alcohol dehydrogenase family)